MLLPVYQSIYDPRFYWRNTNSTTKEVETLLLPSSDIEGEDLPAIWHLEDASNIRKHFFLKTTLLKKLDSKGTYNKRIQIINEYNNKLLKVWDDHRNVLVNEHTEPFNYFQPYDVEKWKNMVTFQGLSRMAKFCTGQSTEYFTYVEIGTGLALEKPMDNKLVEPLARMNVQDLGWFEPSGNTIQTGTMFAENTPSGVISEAAAFDKAVGGTTWWRIFIQDILRRIENILGETVPTLSHIHTLKGK